MRSSLRPTILLAFSALIGSGVSLDAQTLRGRFVQRGTSEPISGARLLLRNAAGTTVVETSTDSAGRFEVEAPGGGTYRLTVLHEDFERVSVPILLRPALELEFQLSARARPDPEPKPAASVRTPPVYVLDPVNVEASPRRMTERRRGTGIHVITRRQIEQRRGNVRHLGDLVRTLPGLSVREGSSGGISRTLCIESDRRYMRGVPSDHVVPGDRCEMVKVIIDDYPVFDPGTYLTMLNIQDLESVEFLSPIEGMVRFGADAARGVLVIYTRGSGPYAGVRRRN